MHKTTMRRTWNRAAAAALGVSLGAMVAGTAWAAPIEGQWRTQSGANATIARCGSAYCVNLTSGEYAGTRIGRLSGEGSKYRGEVTDPTNGKTYSGSATVNGNTLKMRGCVARVLCRTQTWARR